MIFKNFIIIFVVIIHVHHCLIVIYERAQVDYVNPKYAYYGNMSIKRYGRKSPYYLNLDGKIKDVWANNVTLNLIFYEYLHNEYRRTFVEIHFKFCDMMNKDPYIGGMLAKKGITCPLPPGEYRLRNMTIDTRNYPNVWPFEKGQAKASVTTDTHEVVASGYLTITFKKDKSTKK